MCMQDKNYIVVPSLANSNVFIPSEEDWEDYFREQWNYGPTVQLSEELQEAIKSHPNFAAPPIGPIGDCIVSEELHRLIPQSLASCYLVHSGEDVSILREVVAAHGETQPVVTVYPRCTAIQADDEKLTIVNCVPLASLQSENPTIANLLIDYFGTTTGMPCEYLAICIMYVATCIERCILCRCR